MTKGFISQCFLVLTKALTVQFLQQRWQWHHIFIHTFIRRSIYFGVFLIKIINGPLNYNLVFNISKRSWQWRDQIGHMVSHMKAIICNLRLQEGSRCTPETHHQIIILLFLYNDCTGHNFFCIQCSSMLILCGM